MEATNRLGCTHDPASRYTSINDDLEGRCTVDLIGDVLVASFGHREIRLDG